MNAKVAEITETLVARSMDVVDFSINESEVITEIVENEAVKELSCIEENNIVSKIAKRFIDICGGIVGLIVLIPLTIIVYIANKICGDGGPIFYIQERIGKDGKIFKMLKYRSMVVGAEEKLKKYLSENEEARQEYKLYKKLKHDPRITKIGKFLRKTSLDEMPQLLHLLTGEMSLVGPRPYMITEKEEMGEYYNIIVKSKPGITGLWQISGRSNTTFDDRLDLDANYGKDHSLKRDIKILWKTAEHVIKKEGAI